ncbi:MAG: hypothetical protein MUC36_08480 [Planctomycetes bacterium]|nr:hypothetical protein [Planctomycetota bacterium]
MAALLQAILEAAPDPDAIDPVVPEFWPPLPAGAFAERYLQPALRLVTGDAIFEAESGSKLLGHSANALGSSSPLFRDGICRVCNCGCGPRTDVPIRIAAPPSFANGGWIRAAFGDLLRVYSQEFLDLLCAAERARLSLLPVELPAGDRRRFFELRGPAQLQPVGVRDLQTDGQECPECGRREVRVVDPRLREPGSFLRTFVCAGDLPAPLPTVSAVGSGNEVALCVTQDRWTSLRANRRASGLLTEPLGVVAAADCERQPRVRVRTEHCDACCHWPAARTISDQQMAVFELPAEQCSRRNFTWLAEAERDGLVQIVCATVPPLELYELSQQSLPPERTEFVGLRCPRCWRLGWIVLSRDPAELSCDWRNGLM